MSDDETPHGTSTETDVPETDMPETDAPASDTSEPDAAESQPGASAGTIRVSAVVLRDGTGRVLQTRKASTRHLMFPGGKPEPGETYLNAAVREVAEETGLRLVPADLRSLGMRRTVAANEEGFALESAVFLGPVLGADDAASLVPEAEIEELAWVDPTAVDEAGDVAPGAAPEAPTAPLAPLSAEVLRELAD